MSQRGVIDGDVLIPLEEMDDHELAIRVWKLTRLTLFAINGMLLDMDGSVLEEDDVRLIQNVAWSADAYAKEARRRSETPRPAVPDDPPDADDAPAAEVQGRKFKVVSAAEPNGGAS